MIKRGINYEGLCIKVDAASSSSHGLRGLSGSLSHQSQLASGHQQQQLQAQPRKRIDFKLPPSVAEQPQPWHHQSAASTANTAASASSRFSLSGGAGGGSSGGHGGPPVESNPTSSVTTTSSHTNNTVSQASSHSSQPNETKNISISSQPPSSSIPLLPLVPSCLSSLTASDDKEEPTISTASEDNGGLSKKE